MSFDSLQIGEYKIWGSNNVKLLGINIDKKLMFNDIFLKYTLKEN